MLHELCFHTLLFWLSWACQSLLLRCSRGPVCPSRVLRDTLAASKVDDGKRRPAFVKNGGFHATVSLLFH